MTAGDLLRETPALWLVAPLVPLVLAAGLVVPAWRAALLHVAPWAALPALVLALVGQADAAAPLPWLFLGARVGLDEVGRPFLLLTGLGWLAAGVHARGYLAADPRRDVFTRWFLLAMSGNVGLVLARDALTFLLFFSLMSLGAYGLVVHDRRPSSVHAGRVYITLVVLGEMALYVGVLLWVADGGGLAFEARPPHGRFTELSAGLLLAGFGIKAGAAPLHLWLPLAHPAAPTPASAVLSGAMIKAGLLGWLRFLPLGEVAAPGLAVFCMVQGFASAFLGVIVGVTQRDPKTLLAYSSISQMGLMNVGVGAALLDPRHATTAVAAVALFAVHHSLAKAALFLGAGAIGSWPAGRAGRALFALALTLPALALAGVPPTSGAVAKAGLKEALQAAGVDGAPITLLALSTVGTTVLMTRLLLLLRARAAVGGPLPASVVAGWGAMVVASGVGLWLLPWPDLREAVLARTHLVPGWYTIWPVAAGLGLVGLWGWLVRAGRAPAVPEVPAGDLVVPLERALRRAAGTWAAVTAGAEGLVGAGRALAGAFGARGAAALGRLGRVEAALLRWEVSGGALLLVLVALFVALTWG
ncbi:MAG: complex I subunit 5 family protein [Planctomycetes bacterium]|nr:complex I subunit 5 family protein [Planctomycetota bacterium]